MTEERTLKSSPGSTYWLIAKDGNGLLEVLTIGDEEALPVFSFREEAELFLGLRDLGDRWRPRESGAGETLSILYGLCGACEKWPSTRCRIWWPRERSGS